MKKFKCRTMKGTLTQFYTKIFAIMILATTLVIFFLLNGYDVNFAALSFFAVIGISIPLVFIPMRKYSSVAVEITDKELRFLNKSNTVKFTIPIVDIESSKPEPHLNTYGDRDLNTKLTVKTKSGQIFSIFLPEEGAKYIGELVGKTVFDESNLKKIPLYMHILFAFAVILVPLFITLAIVAPDSLFKDTGDYVKFFIYIPILIGIIVYYIQLRKRTKQK